MYICMYVLLCTLLVFLLLYNHYLYLVLNSIFNRRNHFYSIFMTFLFFCCIFLLFDFPFEIIFGKCRPAAVFVWIFFPIEEQAAHRCRNGQNFIKKKEINFSRWHPSFDQNWSHIRVCMHVSVFVRGK